MRRSDSSRVVNNATSNSSVLNSLKSNSQITDLDNSERGHANGDGGSTSSSSSSNNDDNNKQIIQIKSNQAANNNKNSQPSPFHGHCKQIDNPSQHSLNNANNASGYRLRTAPPISQSCTSQPNNTNINTTTDSETTNSNNNSQLHNKIKSSSVEAVSRRESIKRPPENQPASSSDKTLSKCELQQTQQQPTTVTSVVFKLCHKD